VERKYDPTRLGDKEYSGGKDEKTFRGCRVCGDIACPGGMQRAGREIKTGG
jgi:hypothetical protein